VLDAVELELENIEDKLSADRAAPEHRAALFVKQKLTALKHVTRLHGVRWQAVRRPRAGVCSGSANTSADVYDHLVRSTSRSTRNATRQHATGECRMITYGRDRGHQRLAAWAALIAVPTFIASLVRA